MKDTSYILSEINYFPVDGVKTKVYTKYLTGTTDADATTNVAHGVTNTNILHVSVTVQLSGGATYLVYDMQAAAVAANSFYLYYDASDIILGGVGANCQSQAYRIKIEYTS